MAKPALGRGLGALLGGASPGTKPAPAAMTTPGASAPAADAHEGVQRVAVTRVRPCPQQPRKDFAPEALRELADSIREQGIIQPLIVRERNGGFELIAGERRWRAAQLAGLTELPIIVREADDRAVLELALIENLQRENLNPIEEAQGYARLIGEFQLRQEDASVKVGTSRAAVANALRLLRLPPEVQTQVRDGRLSVGHAKVILALASAADQTLAAERVIQHSLNVRQTEVLVSDLMKPARATGLGAVPVVVRDANIAALENRLRERFGTKVQLRYRQGKGAVEIRFFSDAELERVLQIAGVKME